MMLDIQVDTRALEDKLYLLAKAAQVAPGVVIKEETKAIVKNILQLTPPKSLSQGRGAVERDIKRVAPRMDPVAIEKDGSEWGKAMAKNVRKRNIAAIEAMLRNSRGMWRGANVVKSADELGKIHIQNRKPNGRTSRTNNLTFIRDSRAYVTEIQKRVGWAKAGWVATADKVGLAVPAYIRRLAAVAGQCVASFGENPGVFAVAHNNKIPGYQKEVNAAVNNRVRVTETKINRLVAGKAVNLGFKVVEGTR